MAIPFLTQSTQNIVITSHQSPDGDAIGSALALFHYLNKLNHNVSVVIPDEFPDYLQILKGFESIILYENQSELAEENIQNADVIFALDYNNLSRVFVLKSFIEKSPAKIALIDHHTHPDSFYDWGISNPKSASTCELVYQFIIDNHHAHLLDKDIALCLYTGTVTDTESFKFPLVDATTHKMVAHLLDNGLEHSKLHNALDENKLNTLEFLGYVLSQKLQVLPNNSQIAIIDLTLDEQQKFDLQKGDTEGLVNYALSIKGVNVAVFMREDTSKIKFSFRSKPPVCVNEFASLYFEGGGHQNAAGGMYKIPFEQAKSYLIDKLNTFYNE